jgi:hypothetical protein
MLYLVDRETPEQLIEHLARFGFKDPDPEMLTAPVRSFYFPEDQFSDDHMLELVKVFYTEALASGYSGARGTGEMSWTLRGVKGAELALRYEARLTEVLVQYPALAICQYDTRLFDGATVMDVLSTHPYSIVHGQLVKNPYFVEPARFLERYRAAHN